MDTSSRNQSSGKLDSALKIDKLNDRAWSEKFADAREALDMAKSALTLAAEIDYKTGCAYALRNVAACHWILAEYDEGSKNAQEALHLFEELHDSYGLAHVLNVLGNICDKTGEHAEALDYFTKSLKIREEIGDKEGTATSLNNIGNVYFSFGRLADALECYLKAWGIHEEVNNLTGVSRSLNNIGNIYARLGEFQKAVETLNRSLEIKKHIGDKVNEGKVLLNLGDAHLSRESYEEALEYYLQSLNSSQSVGDRITETSALGNIGQIYEKLGNYDEAFDYYLQCLEAARDIGVKYSEAEALVNLGSIHVRRNEFEEGLMRLDYALVLTDELRANELTQRIHSVLSRAYESQGDLALALHHHKLFHQTFRRVFGEETEQKVKSLAVQFEIERAQKEAEIHRLRNVELAQANEALREANHFKTELLHIAAHDLKNPLQSILGFTELISQEVEGESSITNWSQEIYDSSQRMIGLINIMLKEAALESGQIKLELGQVAIEALARKVVNQNYGQAERKEQSFVLDFDLGCFAEVDKQRLSEAFDNLISNAIKYSEYGKRIEVSVKQLGNRICFAVKDEGPGLTEEDKKKLFQKFQRLSAQPTGGESSARLGLAITKLLVELHGGKIWATSEHGKGSTFVIEVPATYDEEEEAGKVDPDKTVV
jgi:signal transduction histidine kinase